MNNEYDPFTESDAGLLTDDHPCNCGKSAGVDLSTAGANDIPPIEELETLLAGIGSAEEPLAATAGELELAALDSALSAEEELDLPDDELSGDATLGDLIGLAERHPGLKVTISF